MTLEACIVPLSATERIGPGLTEAAFRASPRGDGCAGVCPQRSAPVVCAEAGELRGAGLGCGRVLHRGAEDAGVAVADHGSNLAHARSSV